MNNFFKKIKIHQYKYFRKNYQRFYFYFKLIEVLIEKKVLAF